MDLLQKSGKLVIRRNNFKSIRFTADNQVAVLPLTATIKGQTAATYEFWYKPDSIPTSTEPLLMESTSVTYGALRFGITQLSGGVIQGGFRPTDDAAPAIVITGSGGILRVGYWSHLALTVDTVTDEMYLYFNGFVIGSNNAPKATFSGATSADVRIATVVNNAIRGYFSEVRIWNVARTQAQIQESMFESLTGPITGLVALYKFDDSSTTVLDDSSGNGNHGTSTSTITRTIQESPLNIKFIKR